MVDIIAQRLLLSFIRTEKSVVSEQERALQREAKRRIPDERVERMSHERAEANAHFAFAAAHLAVSLAAYRPPRKRGLSASEKEGL